MATSIINSDDGVVSGTSGLKTIGGNDGDLYIQSNGTTVAGVVDGAFQVGGSNISAANSMGFRNRIINGDMRIDQRNAGAAVIVDGYCLDRWLTGYAGSTSGQITVQQSSDTPTSAGFTNSLSLTVTTADSSFAAEGYYLQQAIEGYNCSDFKWGTAAAKTVTVSFWVKASVTGAYPFIIENSAGTEVYGATYTISSANTWEYKTLTVPGDTTGTWLTTNGSGVRVIFGLGGGASRYADVGWATKSALTYTSLSGAVNFIATSGATFYITGVQLEVGSVATEFERRPYGTELALCQRYYEKTYSLSVAPGTNSQPGLVDWSTASNGSGFCVINNRFSTAKRTAPTLKGWTEGGTADQWYMSRSGSSGNQSVNLDIASEFGFRLYLSTGANWTVCRIEGHWTADAEL